MVVDIHYRDTLEPAGQIEVDEETGAATFLTGPAELEQIVKQQLSNGFHVDGSEIEMDGDRLTVDSFVKRVTPIEAGGFEQFELQVMTLVFLTTGFCTAGRAEVIRRNREEQARSAAPGRWAS